MMVSKGLFNDTKFGTPMPFCQHPGTTRPKKVPPRHSLRQSPFRGLNVGYMDQSNTTPHLQRTNCPPIPTYPLLLFPYFGTMPDWRLPDDIQKDSVVLMKLMHSLAGIYMCIFPGLFLFILLTYPQVRMVHIPRL